MIRSLKRQDFYYQGPRRWLRFHERPPHTGSPLCLVLSPATLYRLRFHDEYRAGCVFNQGLGTMTKVQSVSRPRFRSEDDELMTAKGRLAENCPFFGWTDKCL